MALARGTAGAGDADTDTDAAFMDAAATATDVAAMHTALAVDTLDEALTVAWHEATQAEQHAVTLAELAVRRRQHAVDLAVVGPVADSVAAALAAVAAAMAVAVTVKTSLRSLTPDLCGTSAKPVRFGERALCL